MGNTVIQKDAHHYKQGIGIAEMGQKRAAYSRALAKVLRNRRQVKVFYCGMDYLLGLKYTGQYLQARLRHLDDPGVRSQRSRRMGQLFCPPPGQGVEEHRLSTLRQANNPKLHCEQQH
jgi:hypothetical protein